MHQTLTLFASVFATALLLLSPGNLRAEGDIEAGKLKAYTCTGCHGVPGYNNIYPTYKVPKVAGQNYLYLVAALKAYRDGERDHSTMELQSSSMSEEDIKDVASYFASLGQDKKG